MAGIRKSVDAVEILMKKGVLLYTDFKDLTLYKRGKVRDVYDLSDKLLIISTDRISCFDVVLPCGIPYKGEVLNKLSCFWFEFIEGINPHHFITSDINSYPKELQKYKKHLLGCSMLVKKTKPIAVECVVRGYLSGSGWKEYKKNQTVCGIKLPSGLLESDKLPRVLFTPSTKQDTGHDMNVDQKYIEDLVGGDTADKLKKISIAIYEKASQYALERGIIIADTKFEFGIYPVRNIKGFERKNKISNGVYNHEIMLIDEMLTPDSSRFWPKDQYRPGRPQPSFDKQFVRDYLESLDWDKTPPAPTLPKEIIKKTSQKYLEAYRRLAGKVLKDT